MSEVAIEVAEPFPADQLDQLRALEQRTIAADGGRLKLEWAALESGRVGAAVLAVENSRLVGYLGRYQFGSGRPELAGMVDPTARRRGIGGMLLDTCLQVCAERGDGPPLLVVPRPSLDGMNLAISRGGAIEHSEHSMLLLGEPAPGPSDPCVTLRESTADDFARVSALIEEAFGYPAAPDDSPSADTLVVVRDEEVIGTIRVVLEGDEGGVYGFAITESLRGRGIGRDVLRRACQRLRAQGAKRIRLEVDVVNESALGLYTSLGFRPVTTEDYYLMPV